MKSGTRLAHGIVLALALLATARPAYAYLDPSTASMITSAVIGLLATASLAFKTFFYRIKGFFNKNKDLDHATEMRTAPEDEQPLGN